MIGLRDFQDDKADIIMKYTVDEARSLKSYGELPDTTKINENDAAFHDVHRHYQMGDNVVRALDGAYLEHALQGSRAVVDYQHGLAEVVARVAGKDVTAAIAIRPTSLAEIQRTAREGLLMPPKSTFFTPKLRTGLVVRPTAPLG